MRYIRIKRFSELTGYTEGALYKKIQRGQFIEGQQYRRAPDSTILMDMVGFEKWVEQGLEMSK